MNEKNEWIFDDDNLIEEVPNVGESEYLSLNTQNCINEKNMLKIFNYKNRSCLGKFFCCIFCCECPCCIKIDPLDEKYYFIRLWNKLTEESKGDSKTSSPFQVLINLFAHKFVMEDLKKVRLNPNLFLIESGKRNDLEFYIPQLCNFNLFGGQEQVAQFFYFLCNACFASFFFAHRVYWFMRSFDNADYSEKIQHDLQFLNCVFQSENHDNRYLLTNLFVAGSQKYIDYLNKYDYLPFYKKKFELIDKYSVSNKEIECYNRIMNSKTIINNYSNYMYKKALAILKKSNDGAKKININTSENEKKENKERQQITAENIFINNYSFYSDTPIDFPPLEENDNNDDFVIINNKEDIFNFTNKVDDVNLLSFHSVISFFDDLCKIGRDLIGKDSSQFKEIIINEITKINKNLPANVYLPFLTNNTRNYIIVHIPVTELKVFKTKERVPFMLVFEMIRLDEILYLLQRDKEFPLLEDMITSSFAKSKGDNIIDITNRTKSDRLTEGLLENNNNDEDFGKTRTLQIKKFDSKKKKKDDKKKKKKKKDNIEDQELIKVISESDIELSKEISLELIEEEKNRIQDANKIVEENNDIMNKSQIINNKKIVEGSYNNRKSGLISDFQFLKFEKFSLNNKNSSDENYKRSLSFGDDEQNKISTKKSIKKLINEKEDEINTTTDNKKKEEKEANDINIEENLNIGDIGINDNPKKNTTEKNENDNIIINKKPSVLDDDGSSEQSDEEAKIITTNNKSHSPNKSINIKKIFGEQLEEQKERLQYNSPFKTFKTFTIFKAIIKAGEDLKQEQFATQLISVFREIFSQNGVDCWLSSYEVISTGKDCGLVEMVSNSLSMDQIKKKTGLSLKQFYIEYFGNEKKKKYQQAIKNFIRSLAGYSLVCYFLQIKDRHNGNILIDSKGHLIHIDFGFMLSNAPGKGIKFEKAPFKITDEMLELLGGINSDNFHEYRKKLVKGYFAIYDNFEKIQKLAEFMFMGQGQYFPCFIEKENTLTDLKERLRPRNNMSKQQKIQYIDDLLSKSIDNWTTTYYDKFQYYIQGIFY